MEKCMLMFNFMRFLLFLLPLALAFDLQGRIDANLTLPPQSKVQLDFKTRTLIRQDGSFQISGVQDGQHVVEVLVPGYTFSQYLVTLPGPHVQFHHPAREALSTSSPSLPYPLQLRPLNKDDYFSTPGGMNVFGLIKNPMVLMMLFSAVMMYGMPKIMASMDIDPEMAKEMADTRKKMQGMQNMDWTGSLSTMLAGGTEEVAPIPAKGNGKRRKGR